jgi:hypothetical protein
LSRGVGILGDMTRTAVQEHLPFTVVDDWRLDERTREMGREGLARARAALDAATRRAAQRRTVEPQSEAA